MADLRTEVGGEEVEALRGVLGSPLEEELEEEEERAPLLGVLRKEVVLSDEVESVTVSEGPNETVRLGVDPGRS